MYPLGCATTLHISDCQHLCTDVLNSCICSLWVVGPRPGARLPPVAARAQVQQAGVAVGLHGDAPRHAPVVLRQRPQRVPVARRVSDCESNLRVCDTASGLPAGVLRVLAIEPESSDFESHRCALHL